jgi:uncharacterized membrane protein
MSEGSVSSLIFPNIQLKIVYLILLFGPLGFTPLAAPEFLITSGPSFAEILLQNHIAYRITTQYSALVIPILFTSAIIGTQKILSRLSPKNRNIKTLFIPGLVILSILSCILCTPAPISPYTMYHKFSPNPCQYIINNHTFILNEAISLIPNGVSVSTQNNLASHLSKRRDLFLDYQPSVTYILIDNKTSSVEWLGNFKIIFPYEKYELIFDKDDVQLYRLKI